MCPVYVNGMDTSGSFDPASPQTITGAWTFSSLLSTAAITASGTVATSANMVAKSGDASKQVTVGDVGGFPSIVLGTAADVVLSRPSAGLLKVDSYQTIVGGLTVSGDSVVSNVGSDAFVAQALDLTTSLLLRARIDADSVDRYAVSATGKQSWGDGAAAADVTFERTGVAAALLVATLNITGSLIASGDITATGGTFVVPDASAAATNVFEARVTADPVNRYVLNADGSQDYGSGSAAADVTTGRSGVGEYRITADLFVTGDVGLYNVAPVAQAAAIAAPTSPGIVYSQAEAQSMETAVNALRAALSGIGITA